MRIKRFENFKIFEMSITTEPMISRGNIAIYDIYSWDELKTFFDDNKHFFSRINNVKWSISPQYRDAEEWFNIYLRVYPHFYIIVDEDKDIIIGMSLNDKKQFSGHYGDDSMCSQEVILDYLKKLHLEPEDLV